MKLLSVLLVLVFTTLTFAQDTFVLNVEGCPETTFELETCTYFCELGHFKIVETTPISFNYQAYLDEDCNEIGYFNGTSTKFIIPFVCENGQTVTVDNEGSEVTCYLDDRSSGTSIKSISLAVLFAFALVLSLL